MRKRYLLVLLLLLAIGFAAVTTNLIMNNNATIGISNLDVVFINANASTDSIADISEDGKKITYSSKKLTKVGDEETLYYVVKNNSANYSANIKTILSLPIEEENSLNEYLSYSYENFGTDGTTLEPGQIVVGSITFKLEKPILEDKSFSVKLEINATAIENDFVYTEPEYESGLFDDDGNMLASWDQLINEYNFDVERDYGKNGQMGCKELANGERDCSGMVYPENSYMTTEGSLFYLITNHDELKNATVLSLGTKNKNGEDIKKIGDYALADFYGGVFDHNEIKIDSIILQDGIEEIGSHAIQYDAYLQHVNIPYTVKTIKDYNFYICHEGFNIQLDRNNINYTLENNMLFSKDKKVLYYIFDTTQPVVIPDGVEEIGNGGPAFYSAYNDYHTTPSVTIPSTVHKINDYAFYSIYNVTEPIILPDSVTYIGESAFQGIKIDHEFGPNLEYIGHFAFDRDSKITFKDIANLRVCETMYLSATETQEICRNYDLDTFNKYGYRAYVTASYTPIK